MAKKPLNIVLIGNRGAGKTTLQASMSNKLAEDAEMFRPLILTPSSTDKNADGTSTFGLLQKKWAELLKKLNQASFSTRKPPVLEGTTGFEYHEFIFSDDKKHDVLFRFVDTAGGWSANADQTLVAALNEAVAVICIIDAVDLMEYKEETAKGNCAARGIQKTFEDFFRNDPEKKLNCLFVLTKCEKYMHRSYDAKMGREEMLNLFASYFRPVLTHQNLNSFVLPVETLGSIEFSRIEIKDQDEIRHWRNVRKQITPKNEYLPLCFVMSELWEQMKDKKSFFEWLGEFLHLSEDVFKDYGQKLAELSQSDELREYDKTSRLLTKKEGFEFK